MFRKHALISVFDKKGIDVFALGLVSLGWKIISSGGTATYLRSCGVEVVDVAEITGLPAVLGHRVVTLASQLHGALLAIEEMVPELEGLGWPWIDLVCVDLYPLEAELNNPAATRQSLIDKTDIGGPTLIRSAVKGGRMVVFDAYTRDELLADLRCGRDIDRDRCASRAEHYVARYIAASAEARGRIFLRKMK